MWKSERQKVLFYKMFEVFLIKYTMSGRWNGQTKSEFDKNFKRVSDIVAKSDGDKEKAIKLAKQQTAKITDEWKAINRAMAAKQAGHEYIFEVFFQRAYELGTVTKQEYREYKLEKLGI
jgi:2-methylisocitrate lyase-like PEP mutase family enzyme